MGGSSQETESTTVNKPPQWWEDAAKKAISVADQINQTGYVPYMGNEIAAFTPMQQAGMQSASDWMSAANGTKSVDAMAGMPQAKMGPGGVMGYSSAPGFMQNLELIKQRFPEQYDQLTRFGGDLLANPAKSAGSVKDSPWNISKDLGFGGGGGGGSSGPGNRTAANQAAESVRMSGLYSNGDTKVQIAPGAADRFGFQDYTFSKHAVAKKREPAKQEAPTNYVNPGKWW
jgi:hypothetical protein